MGLATVLAYDPATTSTKTFDRYRPDPLTVWKRARRHHLAVRRPVFWTLAGAFGLLLVFAVRNEPDWAAAAPGDRARDGDR